MQLPPRFRFDSRCGPTWKHLSRLSIVTRASAVSGDMLESCRMPLALISTSKCWVRAATCEGIRGHGGRGLPSPQGAHGWANSSHSSHRVLDCAASESAQQRHALPHLFCCAGNGALIGAVQLHNVKVSCILRTQRLQLFGGGGGPAGGHHSCVWPLHQLPHKLEAQAAAAALHQCHSGARSGIAPAVAALWAAPSCCRRRQRAGARCYPHRRCSDRP